MEENNLKSYSPNFLYQFKSDFKLKVNKFWYEYGINFKMNFNELMHLIFTSDYKSTDNIINYLDRKPNESNVQNNIGWTAVHLIAELSKFKIVSHILIELIKRGANINALDNFGESPLIIASYNTNYNKNVIDIQNTIQGGLNPISKEIGNYNINNDNIEVIRILLKHGANINVQNEYGFSALMLASYINDNKKKVKVLLKNKANINAKNEDGYTALMIAARYSKSNIVELMLKYHPKINARDNSGMTALMHSIYNIHGETGKIVKIMLNHRVNITIKDYDYGWTVLMHASSHLDEKSDNGTIKSIIKYSKKMHIDKYVDTKDDPGWTALMYAVLYSRCKRKHSIIKTLLKYDADVNAINIYSNTPLTCGMFSNNIENILLLLTYGGDYLLPRKNGRTPLERILMMKNKEIRILLNDIYHFKHSKMQMNMVIKEINNLQEID